jgi:hypothetical protein
VAEDHNKYRPPELSSFWGPPQTQGLINYVKENQQTIQLVCKAWDDIPGELFADAFQNRDQFRAAAVREGLFHWLTLSTIRESLSTYIEKWLTIRSIGDFASSRAILEHWVAPLKLQPPPKSRWAGEQSHEQNARVDKGEARLVSVDQLTSPHIESIMVLSPDGAESEPDWFEARIAGGTRCISLKRVFDILGRSTAGVEPLYSHYDVWLIPHRVSVMLRTRFADLTSVGIEVDYRTEHGSSSILSLLPSSQYVQRESLTLGAMISANGSTRPATDSVAGEGAGFVFDGLGFSSGSNNEIRIQFKNPLPTAGINAVGIGSSHCEWRFDKNGHPLFGRDIETLSVVALPRGREELDHRIKVYVMAKRFLWPIRLESNWTEFQAQLVDEAY